MTYQTQGYFLMVLFKLIYEIKADYYEMCEGGLKRAKNMMNASILECILSRGGLILLSCFLLPTGPEHEVGAQRFAWETCVKLLL